MDDRRTRWAGGIFAAVAVTGLGLVVAVAATRFPGRDSLRPFFDIAPRAGQDIVPIVVLAVVAMGLYVVARRRPRRRRRATLRRPLSFWRTMAAMVIAGLWIWAFSLVWERTRGESPPTTLANGTTQTDITVGPVAVDTVGPGWELWALALTGVLAIVYLMWSRRPTKPSSPAIQHASSPSSDWALPRGENLAATDPRRRIYIAYRQVEQASGQVGLDRAPNETVHSHLRRVGEPVPSAAERLAGAYGVARFSPEVPDLPTVEEAERAGQDLLEGLE